MVKKLWRVECEFYYYTLADDANDARWQASQAADALSSFDFSPHAVEATRKMVESDADWIEEYPHEDDGRTCGEIMGIDTPEEAAAKAEAAAHLAVARAAWEAHPKLPLESAG